MTGQTYSTRPRVNRPATWLKSLCHYRNCNVAARAMRHPACFSRSEKEFGAPGVSAPNVNGVEGAALMRRDVRFLDHVAPYLGLRLDEGLGLRRRAAGGVQIELGEVRLALGALQHLFPVSY